MNHTRNFKLELMAFILGLMFGFLFTLWGLSATKMWEDMDWRCVQYSPTTGQCVLLEHKDILREEPQ